MDDLQKLKLQKARMELELKVLRYHINLLEQLSSKQQKDIDIPCTSNSCEISVIPEQTITGKELTNPLISSILEKDVIDDQTSKTLVRLTESEEEEEEEEYYCTSQKEEEEEEEEEEERWHMYYSSFQDILLVGEGDFSFSMCLANSFGSASNIVTTCLESYDELIMKYNSAKHNVGRLKNLGATVIYGVDATTMKYDTDLCMKKFDRIVYNFPHAGFHGKETDRHLLRKHRRLVSGFFGNAESMLRDDGEIHVNHKTTPPFSNWNLGQLASSNSLKLLECVDFRIKDFPGYKNKRGDGKNCDEPFPLGKSSTFKFVASSKKRLLSGVNGVDHLADKFLAQCKIQNSKGRSAYVA